MVSTWDALRTTVKEYWGEKDNSFLLAKLESMKKKTIKGEVSLKQGLRELPHSLELGFKASWPNICFSRIKGAIKMWDANCHDP